MHAIWRLLLDNEFVEAYSDGILIQGADSITRCFFPRFFSYAADYPEKYVSQLISSCIIALIIQQRVLLSCIKFLGGCLCPRFLVKKANVPQMGKPSDMLTRTTEIRTNDKAYQALINKARRLIFKHGKKITGKDVSDLLKDQSLVPTRVMYFDTSIPFVETYYAVTRTDFLSASHPRMLFLIFSCYLSSTYSTSLKSGYGRRYLRI